MGGANIMGKSKLTKSDLVNLVISCKDVSELGVSRRQVVSVIATFVDTLRQAIEKLDDNERIELRGFGTFGVRQRQARIARNPKTNEHVNVPAKKFPYFKAGKNLRAMDK
ncbi:MAG: HU family DNA-binding protein [Brevinema sp.]